jgi:sn-glycerol 3-phosphate transport system substrate-binding protein
MELEHPMRARKFAVACLGLAVCAGLAPLCVLGQSEAPGRKLAFLVAVKTYDHSDLKNLDYTENDVEEFGSVLKNEGFDVVVLTTSRGKRAALQNPTAENIRTRFKTLLRGVTKRDLIVVGLAGHGIQPVGSDDSYFCPADANPVIRIGKPIEPGTLVSIGELLAQLSDSGIGDKLLLVDACRNDPSVRSAQHRGVDHVNVSALPSQTGVLLSCSPGEFSFEEKSLGLISGLKGHGVFFYHVIEGFRGAAKDGRGQVTWDGLGSYVRTEVPQTVKRLYGKEGGEQSPNAIGNLHGAPVTLTRVTLPRRDPAPASESNKPVRIQVWWGIGGPAGQAFEEQVHRFNRSQSRTAVDIILKSGYGGVERELVKALQIGGAPDIAVVEIHSIPRLAQAGGLLPFDDLIHNDRTFQPNDLLPATLMNLRYRGKLFGLPVNRSTPILIYNKDRFTQAGLDPERPPQTWQQVREISKKLTSKDGSRYGLLVSDSPWIFESLVWSNGGELASGQKTTFATSGAKALQLWADMVHRDKTARFGAAAFSEVIQGRAAMAVESTGILSWYIRDSRFNVGTAFVPRFEGFKNAVPTGGGAAVIPARAPQRKAAWEFLTWFTSSQQQADWSRATGYLPVRESARALLQTEGFYQQNPQFETATQQLKFARESPPLPQWGAVWGIVGKAMRSILHDKAPVLETLKAAEKESDALLVPKPGAPPHEANRGGRH